MEGSVTVSGPEGPLATIQISGTTVHVEPADAESHPLVAAVASQLRQSALRRPPRPSC